MSLSKLIVVNGLLSLSSLTKSIINGREIQKIKKQTEMRESLLAKDIREIINSNSSSEKSSELEDLFANIIKLRSDLDNLNKKNEEISASEIGIKNINSAMDEDVVRILSQLISQGLTLSHILSEVVDLTEYNLTLTSQQSDKWIIFTNMVADVVANLEIDINDIERRVALNESFQFELAFNLVALRAETAARLQELNQYLQMKETNLAVQLRSLGALQNNNTVVLTERGELVYSKSVTQIEPNPVVGGTLITRPANGYLSVGVTGRNLRPASLIGDYQSFNVNVDSYFKLPHNMNQKEVYVAIRTASSDLLSATQLGVITKVRNLTATKVVISGYEDWSGESSQWKVKGDKSVTTQIYDSFDGRCFHFGTSESGFNLPELVKAEVISTTPGLAVIRLFIDPAIRGAFSSYGNIAKHETNFNINSYHHTAHAKIEKLFLGEGVYMNWMSGVLIGHYRTRYTLGDFNTAAYKMEVMLKIPKMNISIDGISVFHM